MAKSYWLFAQLIVYFLVTSGFGYQSGKLLLKYLKYETTTAVSIFKFLPEIKIPMIAVCLPHLKMSIDRVDQLFNRMSPLDKLTSDSSWVTHGQCVLGSSNLPKATRLIPDAFLTSTGYGVEYCMSFEASSQSFSSRRLLECDQTALVYVNVTTNLENLYPKKDGTWMTDGDVTIKVKLAPLTMDFESQLEISINKILNLVKSQHILEMSYSLLVTQRLEPPYDTNCEDYRRSKKRTSQANCFNECFRVGTSSKLGMVVDTVDVHAKDYLNSTVTWMPYFHEDNASLEHMRLHIRSNKFVGNSTFTLEQLENLTIQARDIENFCEKTCSRDNCYEELITPLEAQFLTFGSRTLGSQSQSELSIYLLPSNQPVILVESKPALLFIDFFLQVSTCLAFWYGFCPLSIVTIVSKKFNQLMGLCRQQRNNHRRKTRDVFQRKCYHN